MHETPQGHADCHRSAGAGGNRAIALSGVDGGKHDLVHAFTGGEAGGDVARGRHTDDVVGLKARQRLEMHGKLRSKGDVGATYRRDLLQSRAEASGGLLKAGEQQRQGTFTQCKVQVRLVMEVHVKQGA